MKKNNLIYYILIISIFSITSVLAFLLFIDSESVTSPTSSEVNFADETKISYNLTAANVINNGIYIPQSNETVDIVTLDPISLTDEKKISGVNISTDEHTFDEIRIQLALDKTGWLYFNTDGVIEKVGNCFNCYNSLDQINDYIDKLNDLNPKTIYFKLFILPSNRDSVIEGIKLEQVEATEKKIAVEAQNPNRVSPVLECVQDNNDGTFTAFFGYYNRNSVQTNIPHGSKNRLIGSVVNGDTPEVFEPGRSYKDFTVVWSSGNLVWKLNKRTATASFNSKRCNSAPIINDDNVSVPQNNHVDIDVASNDNDLDGNLDFSTLQIVSPPTAGNASIFPSLDGVIRYTPNTGFNGVDSFTYQLCDDDGACGTATVYININAPSLLPISPVTECIDINNDNTYTAHFGYNNNNNVNVNIPSGGDNKLVGSVISGVPPTDFSPGRHYKVFSINWSSGNLVWKLGNRTATASPQTPVCNQGPNINDDTAATIQDTPVNIATMSNDEDIDGNLVMNTFTISTPPSNGIVVFDISTKLVTYTPNPSFIGEDSFEYQICDDDNLCGQALVTVSVRPESPDSNLPPTLSDDIVETPFQTPITIDVLNNDNDPDGTIQESTLTIISTPTNGTISIGESGNVTYAPNIGYSGADTFVYQVCDNQNACDNANVFITIGLPALLVQNENLEIDDFITPAVGDQTFTFEQESCGQIYEQTEFLISGKVEGNIEDIAEVVYSVNDGDSWLKVNTTSSDENLLDYNIPISVNDSGRFTILTRVSSNNGEDFVSEPCEFEVSRPLVLGANTIVGGNQIVPVTPNGEIFLYHEDNYKIFVEAQGAELVKVKSFEDENQTFNLEYNEVLKLWQGNLRFNKPGEKDLFIELANTNQSQSRKINSIVVSERSHVVDDEKSIPVKDARVSIYRSNPLTNSFSLWEGESYNQSNPQFVNQDGEFSLLLPQGEYYLSVEAEGFMKASSRIFNLNSTSLIEAKVNLRSSLIPIIDNFLHTINIYGNNHFSVYILNVDSKQDSQPNINLSDITFSDGNNTKDLDSISSGYKILAHHATWNTQIQEQFINLETFGNNNPNLDVILIGTLDPQSVQESYIDRGLYSETIYTPSTEYYDIVSLSSLSYYLFLDENENVIHTHYGELSLNQIQLLSNNVFGL